MSPLLVWNQSRLSKQKQLARSIRALLANYHIYSEKMTTHRQRTVQPTATPNLKPQHSEWESIKSSCGKHEVWKLSIILYVLRCKLICKFASTFLFPTKSQRYQTHEILITQILHCHPHTCLHALKHASLWTRSYSGTSRHKKPLPTICILISPYNKESVGLVAWLVQTLSCQCH